MLNELLELPERAVKPRKRGLTMVIDGGIGVAAFEDYVRSAGDYIDTVKFGWGTGLVTPGLERKMAVLRELGIGCYLGGTLFEKAAVQNRLTEYLDLCDRLGLRLVEVSNGTVPMSNERKASYIRVCAQRFEVISEVGYKDPDRSLRFSPSQWVSAIEEDLDAGASLVIAEARESGRSGICRPDGDLRYGLVEDILAAPIDVDRLMFEAPTKELQAYFVNRLGADVNVGNIAADDVIGLETLRLGLRSETLMHFEGSRRPAGVELI